MGERRLGPKVGTSWQSDTGSPRVCRRAEQREPAGRACSGKQQVAVWLRLRPPQRHWPAGQLCRGHAWKQSLPVRAVSGASATQSRESLQASSVPANHVIARGCAEQGKGPSERPPR